jgi:glutamate dehydrogenase
MLRVSRLKDVVLKARVGNSSSLTCNKGVFASISQNGSILGTGGATHRFNSVRVQSTDATVSGGGFMREMSSMPAKGLDGNDSSVIEKALIHDMSMMQMRNANEVVPWFIQNMPNSYFRQASDQLRSQHLTVVSAMRQLNQSGLTIKIDTMHDNGSFEASFLSKHDESSNVGFLYKQVGELESMPGLELSRVKVFSSTDRSVDINVFTFEKPNFRGVPSDQDTAGIREYIDSIKGTPEYDEALFNDSSMKEYFDKCTNFYCSTSSPRRFMIQRKMYEDVRGTDRTVLHAEKSASDDSTWFTIVSANILPKQLLEVSSKILAHNNMRIDRSHLDTVKDDILHKDDSYGCVTMLRLHVDDHPTLRDPEAMEKLVSSLKRAKWLDDEVIDLGLVRAPEYGLEKAEIINAFSTVLHSQLAKVAPQEFASVNSVNNFIFKSPHFLVIMDEIVDLFIARFRPDGKGISEADYRAKDAALRERITAIHYEAARVLLLGALNVTQYCLKTNLYHEDRYSLAMRLDPRVMVSEESGDPMPFGIIFATGRNFTFFHNRFRDVARGGLRVVTPPNSEQHALESTRVYGECYGLSWAQQLKNKDIPEGGSKAVCLVNTPAMEPGDRYLECRKAVRGAVDAVLDVTVKESVQKMADHYGKDEQIFLGPDEQVVPSDCDWICQRAGERGYPNPMAFMSSKPVAGFNHKEFGVTSEGVVVNLEVALRDCLGIDARKDKFTVKITGGPDGDVGGNLLKILHREFPDTATVLGVADGMGVAEDPEGLDLNELVRLFNKALPITHFDKSKLSSGGICMEAASEEGLTRRNSMAFRIKSDAFIPAGGRPNTINGRNWKQFLLEDGKTPSSPLIVEGANIFTTPEARQKLFEEAGVAIVKDSSANKCGVITSSQEVACSMLLSTDEFLANKEELVAGVIKHLHKVARLEAELMFKEYKYHPGALPHFSERISNAINFVTDCIAERLENEDKDGPLFQMLKPVLKDNLPEKLAELAWDRVDNLPLNYQKNAIASTLASKMVYHEGIHAIESQPAAAMADRAFDYYKRSTEITQLMNELAEAQETGVLAEESQNKVIDLLRKGGARSSCDWF